MPIYYEASARSCHNAWIIRYDDHQWLVSSIGPQDGQSCRHCKTRPLRSQKTVTRWRSIVTVLSFSFLKDAPPLGGSFLLIFLQALFKYGTIKKIRNKFLVVTNNTQCLANKQDSTIRYFHKVDETSASPSIIQAKLPSEEKEYFSFM